MLVLRRLKFTSFLQNLILSKKKKKDSEDSTIDYLEYNIVLYNNTIILFYSTQISRLVHLKVNCYLLVYCNLVLGKFQ